MSAGVPSIPQQHHFRIAGRSELSGVSAASISRTTPDGITITSIRAPSLDCMDLGSVHVFADGAVTKAKTVNVTFGDPDHALFNIPAEYRELGPIGRTDQRMFSIRVNNNVEIPLPPKVSLEDIQRLPLPVQKLILRGTPRDDIDRERLQWQYRSYYGSVAMLDREIGAIVDALERSGKAANTVVIFSTDHGDQMLEHGLEGKNVFFEASVQVPFMISWPGVIRPSTG